MQLSHNDVAIYIVKNGNQQKMNAAITMPRTMVARRSRALANLRFCLSMS
jgi:hypothetical protein